MIDKSSEMLSKSNESIRKNTDSAEQSAAIQAPANSNMIIVAGAGSGKTYTMTRRVIDLIDRGVAAESILGLTFTNKAASELLARVAGAVSKHNNAAGNNSAVSANAFLKPEVMTYDAFFQSIVRQYGLLVGFDQNTQPLSDAGARELIKPLISSYVTNHPEVLSWYNFDTLIDDVLALASDISCSMIGVNSRGESVDSTAKAVLEIQKWNNAWIEHLQKALSCAETAEITSKKPSVIALRRGKNDSDEKYFKKCANYGKEYVEYVNITLKNTCYESCNKLLEAAKKRAALLDLVLAFDAEKQRANMAQFSDFTIAAYRLVTNFPSIAAQYRKQYSQVLLDEYQDTSTTQAMLIATLFNQKSNSASETDANATNETSANSTHIAAVGDPFQAIYSFRGASSGAFRKLQQELQISENSEFSLTQTRRNAQLILQAANEITKPLKCVPLRKSSAIASEVEVKNLQYLPTAPKGTFAVLNMPTQYEEIEAVVRFAKHVKNASLCKNDDINSASARVAVLFRSKTNIALYEDALQKAGLRTLTVGYSALLEKPEVRDVLALLSVVADHTNTAALMRLMATPRFALKTSDLEAVANIATDANTEYVFRALVQAGLVDENTEKSKRAKVVREQQSKGSQTNSVHGGVFVADVLLEAYAEQLRSEENGSNLLKNLKRKLSAKAYSAVIRVSGMLDAVTRAQSGSIQDIVRTAIETLNIDIDVAVSNALMNSTSTNATLLNDMHKTIDAISALADAYLQEMGDFAATTLRGFISWVLNINKLNDQPASVDEPADVVLMTIHQSKGLEWPAVAIVGLNEGAFPNNQGDALRVTSVSAPKNPGVYKESAYATIEVASKVPVPMRVDADILPRFPHNADLETSMDPKKSLQNMTTVSEIDAEVYGSEAQEMLDLAEKFYEHEEAPEGAVPPRAREMYDATMKTGTLPLSQVEERGRQLHIDERHLMYVALTRAKFTTLLTCSASNAMTKEDGGAESSRAKKPSVFWQEMNGFASDLGEDTSIVCSGSGDEVGCVIGDSAIDFAKLFSEESNIPSENSKKLLAWPSASSENIRNILQKSAKIVAESEDNEKIEDDAKSINSGISKDNSLLMRAEALVQDADLMPQIDWYHNVNALQSRAEQLSKVENVNVTAVQRRATFAESAQSNNTKHLRDEWMAIIRPIPSPASITADLGTRFHTWAEQFVKAGLVNQNSVQYDEQNGATATNALLHANSAGISEYWPLIVKLGVKLTDLSDEQKTLANQLDVAESISENLSEVEKSSEKTLLMWKKRLITSRWAYRRPLAAEQSIVANVKKLGSQIINGKLDAVFAGGLDPDDSNKMYTIVDWKTGKKPTNTQDIALKLGQLDWYRLLLSLITNTPLNAIDATLYYVNIADESKREIHAEEKTKDEILAELHSGTLVSFDDDDA